MEYIKALRDPIKAGKCHQDAYSDFKSQVICNTGLTDAFSVTTGVKQGCILSPFLFILGINWVLRHVTSDVRRGIRWTLTSVLEDLDYADDIVLLAHRH